MCAADAGPGERLLDLNARLMGWYFRLVVGLALLAAPVALLTKCSEFSKPDAGNPFREQRPVTDWF